jgi:hypothetical protein
VGTGRCGSSLIHEILARDEQIGFISNLEDNLPWLPLKGRWNNAIYSATRGAWTRKGAIRFAPSEAYRLIAHHVSASYENTSRDLTDLDVTPWLRQRFMRFFAARYAAQARPVFLHKYTGWPRIGFFAEIFPEARFVNVVRDGRAVANSWLQMPWWGGYRGPANWQWGPLSPEFEREWQASASSYVTLAGIGWKLLMQAYEAAAQRLGPGRYLQVRYEDFLSNPQEFMTRIAEFLGLDRSVRLSRALSSHRLDNTRSRAFERDLSVAQRAELQRCLEPILRRYNYDD